LGLRLAFAGVWDAFCIAGAVTCDLQKKPAVKPKFELVNWRGYVEMNKFSNLSLLELYVVTYALVLIKVNYRHTCN